MIDTEEIDITSPEEGVISSKAVERMVDSLALDEMYSLRFSDVQFVLKDLLRDKYKRMSPTELYKLHKDRFYYTYSNEGTPEYKGDLT
tara:strand:- start:1333 stop:1596 length:264 start_codon:yes stop_codon:yes gene_type:complete